MCSNTVGGILLPPAVIVTVTFRPVTRGCGLEQNCHYVGPFCALLTPQCEVRTWSHEARLTPGSSARCSPFYATDVTTADCNLRLSQEYILRTDHSLVIPRQGFLRADMNHVGGGREGLGLDSGTHVCDLWLRKRLRETDVEPTRGRE